MLHSVHCQLDAVTNTNPDYDGIQQCRVAVGLITAGGKTDVLGMCMHDSPTSLDLNPYISHQQQETCCTKTQELSHSVAQRLGTARIACMPIEWQTRLKEMQGPSTQS